MKKTLLSAVFFLFYFMASASPIDPISLREFIFKSDYIVQGRAVFFGTETPTIFEDRWKTNFVLLRVDEVLQGQLHTDTVKVYYYGAVICPAPPQFVKDGEGIFFLRAEDKQALSFHVYGLSYGTKNFTDRQKLTLYKQRITEMQAICRMQDKQRQEEATTDWLVSCAINPNTRMEGLYDLRPEHYKIAGDIRYRQPEKEVVLSLPRRQRIFNVLMARDTLRNIDMDLVDLARGVNDPKLLEKLKEGLNCIDTAGSLLFIDFMMERVVKLTGDSELQALLTGFRRSEYRRGAVRPDKKLFLEFRRRMQSIPLKKEAATGGGMS